MTDEEKENLNKLEKEDLIEMLGTLKDKNEILGKTAQEERTKIMRQFLDGDSNPPDDNPPDDNPPDDFTKSNTFKKLQNRIKVR